MDRPERSDSAAGVGSLGDAGHMDLASWTAAGRPPGSRLRLRVDEPLEEHYADLARQREIVLAFPAFTDGRGFSHARKLRQAGFDGPLLADGDILADQWEFLRRCGFTALAGDSVGGTPGFKGFSVAYQPR
jgi:uncharacterized protein (DUF934 family)